VDIELRTQMQTMLSQELKLNYEVAEKYSPMSDLRALTDPEINGVASRAEFKVYKEKTSKITYKGGIVAIVKTLKKCLQDKSFHPLLDTEMRTPVPAPDSVESEKEKDGHNKSSNCDGDCDEEEVAQVESTLGSQNGLDNSVVIISEGDEG
jgi:hypothetical protein